MAADDMICDATSEIARLREQLAEAQADAKRLRAELAARRHPLSQEERDSTEIEHLRAALAEKDAALRECARLIRDAQDSMDPIIFEKDWASDEPSDAMRAWTHALDLAHGVARRALSEHPPAPAPKEGK